MHTWVRKGIALAISGVLTVGMAASLPFSSFAESAGENVIFQAECEDLDGAYNDNDYISLTDMARSQMQEHIIFRWLSLKSTLEYIGEWEMLYNPSFNCTEFGTIKNMA